MNFSADDRDILAMERRVMRMFGTYLHILQAILLTDAPQNILLAAFLHLPGEQELIQNEVCFLEVENDVQFTNIAVVLVHLLNIAMYDLEGDELIICRGAAGDEEERSISPVHNLCFYRCVRRVSRA
jgi:hypothetical protein